MDRRSFLGGAAAVGLTAAAAPVAAEPAATPTASAPSQDSTDRFDPWVEVHPDAVAHNVGVIDRLTDRHPIVAVIKNNAYGLGLIEAAGVLSAHPRVAMLAVVKPEDAIALVEAGIDRPVLLMGMAPDDTVSALVSRGVRLSLYLDDDARRLPALVDGLEPIRAHVYLDTGMSRMGIPYHRALEWLPTVAASSAISIEGTYMGFTEDTDFDPVQLRRFREVATAASERGIDLGALHAASSNAVYHLPDAHLDLVRPGIALFGGYPSRPEQERALAELEPAVSLRCRVVRVERLRSGDSVSYGRSYIADRPTWIATLPVGHVDGYPRDAVDGARVLIEGETYPVIGAVSASHVIVEVGDDPTVSVGDVATLVGRGHHHVHPNEVARASSSSVYDRFMHLNPSLPRRIVQGTP